MLKVHEEEKSEEEKAVKNNEHFIKDLEKCLDRSKNKRENAIKQFDTLMVAISTAGIGFVTAYIKDLEGDLLFARISQMAFVICLFINLFSHVISLLVNTKVENLAQDDLNAARYGHYPRGIKNANDFEKRQDEKYKKKTRLDYLVISLNILAFLLLAGAVVMFMLFATAC